MLGRKGENECESARYQYNRPMYQQKELFPRTQKANSTIHPL
jgi:hypothetical protein